MKPNAETMAKPRRETVEDTQPMSGGAQPRNHEHLTLICLRWLVVVVVLAVVVVAGGGCGSWWWVYSRTLTSGDAATENLLHFVSRN